MEYCYASNSVPPKKLLPMDGSTPGWSVCPSDQVTAGSTISQFFDDHFGRGHGFLYKPVALFQSHGLAVGWGRDMTQYMTLSWKSSLSGLLTTPEMRLMYYCGYLRFGIVYIYIYWSIYLSIDLFIYLFIHSSINLFIFSFVCLFMYSLIHVYIYIYIYIYVCVWVCVYREREIDR